jgi:hypothetical protein
MTEAEWLDCNDPTPMLEFLLGKASGRKFRLFACACSRRIWHLLTDIRSRVAVEVAEQCADGQIAWHQLSPYYDAASEAAAGYSAETIWFAAARAAADTVRSYPSTFEGMMARAANAAAGAAAGAVPTEPPVQAILLRDIMGNPFQPFVIESSLLTMKVADLTHAIYDGRAFDHLPGLADALEEAGCQDANTLGHCRQSGPHVRGCWVVDLLMGKE